MYGRFPVLRRKWKAKSQNLSGGEQQMLVIALALMTRARLLLMDEPSQGLAPLMVNDVADRIYVLENGKIAFEAKSTDMSVEYAKKIYLGG
jgi:branched-chain amino acid transport system ATP-binding protein